eukprot:5888387-Ditylum_brightwellii.AAC.1
MKTKCSNCAAISMWEQIYVMGGFDGSNVFPSVEVLTSASNQWTSLPPMKTMCSACAAASMGEQIYVMGGANGSNILIKSVDKCSSCAAVSMGEQTYVMGVCARQLAETSLESDITSQQQMTQ